MTPNVEKLLFTAASSFTDPEERQEFLDYTRRHDPDLWKRLQDLLELQGVADTFFEFQPDVKLHAQPAQTPAEEGLGAHIGRYRLIVRIGAGGCGVVYLAEQEEPVRRKVALKIVKLGMDTEAVIARFGLERQALAQMDHPNIARVLDAGATASGRPYFVMEVVDGEKITDFCDANRLNIRQRLSLFVQICRAIQHAHQKGIVHRDIKPSNVLVHWQEGVPVPKIIDFGIAKATGASVTRNPTFTQSDQFLGTPAYMSPEQARDSAEVDTRSDIYSLGVLLYELLSGCTPFNLKRLTDGAPDEARRIIRDEEPARPSAELKQAAPEKIAEIAENRSTDRAHLVSQLEGDLDWIIMKAMEKEPGRRYDTATGFAMEVLRYLQDEPVLARPPSRTYLLGKFVRRNRLIFTAGSIAIFGLIVGLGASTWMFLQEKAAREEQARLRQKAELRERIANAAVKVSYGDLAGADALLSKVPIEQTFSSLEAANAFRIVADWHVHAGRMQAAAARFTSMIKALSSVDNSDLPSVSFNLLPVAAAVAYTEGRPGYEAIRQIAMQRFCGTANPQVAEQTLKGCLLMPADDQTVRSLAPLAGIVQRAIDSREGLIGTYPYNTAWACFAISLMDYRAGEFARAAEWAQRCLASPDNNEVRTATMGIVLAMIEQRSGQPDRARATLEWARRPVDAAMRDDKWENGEWPLFWFDWINASILLKEAEQLIGRR
jgi:serine/threonine protein kinase